ncbi:MAG TPA: GNAT family N-acetyltransferase [Paludibacter sp.]|nr:GNAT family N-acetyltransferase [Paludibacter sp.]
MLTFIRISGIADDYFPEMFALYVAAFPKSERRSWAGFAREVDDEKRFHANAIVYNGEFAGFFNYWDFGHFVYVEHFAIIPRLRSQKIGTRVMHAFMERMPLPIVLEVEMPNNAGAIKRIRFYSSIGFRVLSHHYAQPPYEGDGFLSPMLLMSSALPYAGSHYESIRDTLYKNVYRFENLSEGVGVNADND